MKNKGGDRMNKDGWRKTAIEIALTVFLECGNDEEKALKLIDFMANDYDRNVLTTDIDNAYNIVYNARKSNYNIFEEANMILVEEGGDKIGPDETIDDVISRLARLIVREKAIDYYIELEQDIKTEGGVQ
jgi:hypothetical protein